jgi:uncharacterized protein
MKREIQKNLINRLQKWRSVALLGARQVGKSYLLLDILKNNAGTYISFDDPLERQEAAHDPLRYLEKRYKSGEYLFIDEAARVPEIFSAVKILVDRNDPEPTKICLANSGNYLLLRKIKESLAGRASLVPLYPLSWQELGDYREEPGLIELIKTGLPENINEPKSFVQINRSREDRLLWGGFPTPALNPDVNSRILWIRDYVRTYILPMVIEQFNIRETAAFEQAARLLFLQNGRFLNASDLARSVGVSQPTIMNYVYYLEAMMVIERVPAFFRNMVKRLVKQPKIYVCDPLLFNECNGLNLSVTKMIQLGTIGRLYESFIFCELRKILSNWDILGELFCWRTQDKAEVDIVLSTGHDIIPFEVKWSAKPGRKDVSGINSFMEAYPEAKHGFIVYPGQTAEKITDKITAIPDWWLLGCF